LDEWLNIIAQNGPSFAILAAGMWAFITRRIITRKELEERDAIWAARLAEEQRRSETWQELGLVNIEVAKQVTSRSVNARRQGDV
jgi:hypothetical protein